MLHGRLYYLDQDSVCISKGNSIRIFFKEKQSHQPCMEHSALLILKDPAESQRQHWRNSTLERCDWSINMPQAHLIKQKSMPTIFYVKDIQSYTQKCGIEMGSDRVAIRLMDENRGGPHLRGTGLRHKQLRVEYGSEYNISQRFMKSSPFLIGRNFHWLLLSS